MKNNNTNTASKANGNRNTRTNRSKFNPAMFGISREDYETMQDLGVIKTAETPETAHELSNREAQFKRLLVASDEARDIQQQLIEEASSEAAVEFLTTRPLNYFILKYVYGGKGITEFNKFNEWINKGASVKKGEKAYPIWGQPVGAQKENEAEAKGEEYKATETENRRFPMCYVFSNLQVNPITAKEGGNYVNA